MTAIGSVSSTEKNCTSCRRRRCCRWSPGWPNCPGCWSTQHRDLQAISVLKALVRSDSISPSY